MDDAVNFRRARFDFGGTFYKNIDFLMEFDFINTFNAERDRRPAAPPTRPVPTDLWVTFKRPALRRQPADRQPEAADRLRAPDQQPLPQLPGAVAGVRRLRREPEQRLRAGRHACLTPTWTSACTWAVGVFKNTRNIFGWNVGDGEYDVTGRVTCLPIYENDGEYLVHVGLGASHRDLDDEHGSHAARMLLRNGPAVLHNIVAEVRTLGD